MNYQNLENEIKKFSDFFKSSQSTFLKFSTYYKEIGKIGSKFADKMKKLLDEFFVEFSKEDRSTTFNKLLTNFYNEKKSFINQMKNYFTLLEKTHAEKISTFEKDHINKNKENISKLSKLNSTLTDSKNQVDKWKNQYFDMCKSIVETGKKIRNLEQNEKNYTGAKEKEYTENLNKLKTQLTKYKDLKELKKKNYKEEQIKLNKLLEGYENNYNNIKALIEKEYCNRIDFISKIIIEINKNSSNFINQFNESIKKIDALNIDLNIKRDERTFRQDYNFYINKDNTKVYKRFIPEEFLDYDFIIEKSEKSSNQKTTTNNILNDNTNDNNDDDSDFIRAKFILNLGTAKYIDFDDLNDKGKEINKIISKILNDENKIEDSELLEIINYIENNGDNCNNLMELLVTHFCQNEFIIIKNIDNFHNLINILIIILNFIFDKKEFFDICFFVIFISEKCIYFSKDDTQTNLSIFKNISKQRIFNSVNFWKDLINARVEMVSKLDIRKEFEKRRKNMNVNQNKFLGKLFGGKKENEIIENEILKNQIYKEKSNKYLTIAFYDFLKHFMNFNFLKAEELLKPLIEQYKLDEKTVDYFTKIIKTNILYKEEKEIDKKETKNNNKQLFNFKSNKQFKNIKNLSIKSILFSLKYIEKSQYPSIICLNKEYHKNVLKIIYKNILFNDYKNIDVKKHLEIWKILLNYKDIKKEYNYIKIKESNKDPNKKVMCSEIIDLDILRTFFSKNREEKMEKIGHILKAISSELPHLNYYQGMNQMAAFLLNINDNNEEEAFYIFMSFLKNTEYCNLYKNDLEKMNVLFYMFDRLLNLYLPEIYTYFKVSSINSGYFISPWFITLFTNAFIDIENKNNCKSIMFIWDLFIFSGWKEILKIGIILLKLRERDIMKQLSECLLPILTADILKSEIFDSEHYEELIKLSTSSQFKISHQLIEEMIKEYEIKKTIPFFINETNINSY